MSWQQDIMSFGELSENESLASRTTMGTGGAARWFLTPKNRLALQQALPSIPEDVSVVVLGRGSNLLIPDEGVDALVLDLSKMQKIDIDGSQLRAEAGMRMPKIAQAAASAALTGMEFMATVPGDLGGGIVMNAGAFGQQVSDTLQAITIMDRAGNTRQLNREELNMSYRHTEIPTGTIVLEGEFALTAGNKDEIKNTMRNMRSRRSSTQPLALPNCGSVFKNPEGDHAARLIEACGLKGRKAGGAKISDQHANFIVNVNQASTADVLQLIELARSSVQEKFGVLLETEVHLMRPQI